MNAAAHTSVEYFQRGDTPRGGVAFSTGFPEGNIGRRDAKTPPSPLARPSDSPRSPEARFHAIFGTAYVLPPCQVRAKRRSARSPSHRRTLRRSPDNRRIISAAYRGKKAPIETRVCVSPLDDCAVAIFSDARRGNTCILFSYS